MCCTDEVSMTGYSSDTNDVELDQHGLMATFEGASIVWPTCTQASDRRRWMASVLWPFVFLSLSYLHLHTWRCELAWFIYQSGIISYH